MSDLDLVPNWDLGFDVNEFFSTEKEPSNHSVKNEARSRSSTDNRNRPTTEKKSSTVLPKVLDSVQNFIDNQKKFNTVNATKQHVKTLTNWLIKLKNESRPIEEIEPERLNLYLQEFFVSIKKKDGSDYEPASLDAMRAAIDRHLKDKGYDKSIISDPIFIKTRQAHTARKLAVKKIGLGRKPRTLIKTTQNA